MPYEVVEHIADLKIRVWGNSLENLFREAVLIMMKLIKTEPEGTPTNERQIEIEAPDATALLVDFLSGVLALSQTHKEVYTEVKFNKFSPSANSVQARLKAVLRGRKVDEFDEDIKAVTYHEAEIQKNQEGKWQTFLVFDI